MNDRPSLSPKMEYASHMGYSIEYYDNDSCFVAHHVYDPDGEYKATLNSMIRAKEWIDRDAKIYYKDNPFRLQEVL